MTEEEAEIVESGSEEEEETDEGVHRCELCGTTRERTNLHHLVPKLVLKRRRHKKAAGSTETVLARLCRTCHHTLHEKFTHTELAKGFASIADIESRPEMADYLAYKRARA